MARILIIEARFYDHIADGLLAGAQEVLDAAGVSHDLLTVPGIFELPGALNLVLAAADRSTESARYDGFVALGCAIRGETDHYHHVGTECMRGLADLSVAHRLAFGNGVLTCHDEAQSLNRADPKRKNLGGQAARACLRMLAIKRELGLAE
ncbi:6,7-dimethyl-8-ribityllumazine synthase [Magnetospirillum fulvum]|uniref:6,7-dimethyl-8-ribityllumazine synthase n=1 Tax=Magnetospirillum fulvum TaxID=1082 RepID=A0A1H6GST5_MAGFU|nr:6,7-dimethyl-8-ribityllumazine synthase [Magnetospirillum fulvum]SEH25862.1 6,7-dimethyl-8-ribityllumazine synthase [Magnetospirillum fulvum]